MNNQSIMGYQIIKTPQGVYNIFDGDQWIIENVTEDQVATFFVHLASFFGRVTRNRATVILGVLTTRFNH